MGAVQSRPCGVCITDWADIMTRGAQSEQARREGVHRSTVSRRVRKGTDTETANTSNDLDRTKSIERMKKQMGAQ